MRAVKANKEYRVNEDNKQYYLNEGYDIIDDEGKIIEYSPKKTIKYSEYQKLEKELEKAKANKGDAELTKQVDKLTKQLEKASVKE